MFGIGKRKTEGELPAVQPAEEEKVQEAPSPAEPRTLSEEEMSEFEEYRRSKKMAELRRLLGTIDHTLLKQTATRADIRRLCEEAADNGSPSLCVQPASVSLCADAPQPAPQPSAAESMEEKVKLLTQYKQLLDSGILTQEEFDKLKAETLGKQ